MEFSVVCVYVEFLGHQEQHLEFIDAAAAHMSAYDDNPRAQARARQGDILVVVEPQTTENSKNPIFQVAPVLHILVERNSQKSEPVRRWRSGSDFVISVYKGRRW